MMAMDIRDLMLDGCMCPCGCGELALHEMVGDDTADAILELEAWADWWMDPVRDCPFPPGRSLYRPSNLSSLAFSAFDAAYLRFYFYRYTSVVDDTIAESFFNEYGHPRTLALPFLEAAAMLRDGWRP